MNLPKWLVIVGILIVVLGVLACGIGVGRELTEPETSAAASPRADLDLVPTAAVPARDIRLEGGASCSRSEPSPGVTRFTGTTCLLAVDPNPIQPRELRLRVVARPATAATAMTVEQELRGEARSSDAKSFVLNELLEVRIGGTTTVRTRILCSAACTMQVIE